MAAPSTGSIRAHYDKEDAIEHLYDVTFLGKEILTTVTMHPDAVKRWIDDVKSDNDNNTTTSIYNVGFEVEIHNGGVDTTIVPSSSSSAPRIGTAQFCVGNRCLIIQLPHPSPCPPALYEFLADEKNGFVGTEVEYKLQLLRVHFDQQVSVLYMDLGKEASACDRYHHVKNMDPTDTSSIAEVAFGVKVEMPRGVTADWGRAGKLSDAQVQYACMRAFLSLQLTRWLILD